MNSLQMKDKVVFLPGRRARFRFQCEACGRCCSEYRIMLSPYDIIRLRRATGRSSGELIGRGTIRIEQAPAKDVFGFAPIAAMFELFGLSQTGVVPIAVMHFRSMQNGGNACEFLAAVEDGKRLCTVYEHRPGMCRLHPLGCVTVNNRRQWFFRQPLCRTDGGAERTVEEWIRVSRLKPFLTANARYLQWIRQLLEEHEILSGMPESQWKTLERILYDFDSINMESDRLFSKGIERAGRKNMGSVPIINMKVIDGMFQRWLSQARSARGMGGRDACRSDC